MMRCGLLLLFLTTVSCVYGHGPVPTFLRRTERGPDGSSRLVDANSESFHALRHKSRVARLDMEATLQVTPSSNVKDGETLTLSWSGISDPTDHDYVSLLCPPEQDPHYYLDYLWADNAPTWNEGYGNITMTVSNIRQDCQFFYYRNNTYDELIAASNTLQFDANQPLGGHISRDSDPSAVSVMWVSGSSQGQVVYGDDPNTLTNRVSSSHSTYTADDLCGTYAQEHFLDPGMIHTVWLKDLALATTYYYRYGTNDDNMSELRNFTTPPQTGAESTTSFVAYGDMGLSSFPGAYDTVKLVLEDVQERNVSLVFHIGDISYALGNAYVWDQWFGMIEPLSSSVPYLVGIGNHEYCHTEGGEKDPSHAPGNGFHPSWGNYWDDSRGECGVPVYHRFTTPDNGNSVFWNSWDHGNVHFVSMSSEHDFTPGSEQYEWIERDLASVDRDITPWLVVGAHRPMYSSEMYENDYIVSLHFRELMESLLYKYKVDLFLAGHYHAYERTCPVFNGTCQYDAGVDAANEYPWPTHIVVGSAGAGLDDVGLYGKDWSLFFSEEWGYGRVKATKDTLHWEWVMNKEEKVMDEVVLHKPSRTPIVSALG